MKNRFDSIIFDLDGTLWDSTEEIYESWAKVLRTLPDIHRLPTREEQAGVMGLPDDLLMQKLFPGMSAERGKEVFDLCGEEENKLLSKVGGKPYEKITETLKALSEKYPLAIVSNCNAGYIDAYLASMGTGEYFSDFESFGRTGKPKSENIKDVVERNGYKNPVYVGDTVWDKEAATAAGVPFIFAAYGFGRLDEKNTGECEFVINTPAELAEKLL